MEKKNLQGVELTDNELEEVSGGWWFSQLAQRVRFYLSKRSSSAVSSNAVEYWDAYGSARKVNSSQNANSKTDKW